MEEILPGKENPIDISDDVEPVDLHDLENTRGLGGGSDRDDPYNEDHDMGGHEHGGMRCAQQ